MPTSLVEVQSLIRLLFPAPTRWSVPQGPYPRPHAFPVPTRYVCRPASTAIAWPWSDPRERSLSPPLRTERKSTSSFSSALSVRLLLGRWPLGQQISPRRPANAMRWHFAPPRLLFEPCCIPASGVHWQLDSTWHGTPQDSLLAFRCLQLPPTASPRPPRGRSTSRRFVTVPSHAEPCHAPPQRPQASSPQGEEGVSRGAASWFRFSLLCRLCIDGLGPDHALFAAWRSTAINHPRPAPVAGLGSHCCDP